MTFEDSKEHFFNMFDKDLSNSLSKDDVKKTMDSSWSEFTHDRDNRISQLEWDRQTRRIFVKICENG